MNAPRPLHRLLRLIADTAENEISCSECFSLLPQFAELELADPPAVAGATPLHQHLAQCAVCREEYEVLRDLLRADAGPPPSEPT